VKLGKRYLIEYANSGDRVILDGYTLKTQGLPYYLGTAKNSEMILISEEISRQNV